MKNNSWNLILKSFLLILVSAGEARADYCVVKPTSVIIHTNQIVYFTAEPVCQAWCQLPPGWSDAQKDRAVALLTTAISQERPLTMFFPGQCVRQSTYAEPELIQFVGR